ncbi:putative alkyl salicylate esterase [Alcanivorax balearicus MACL04]|uniref:Alkyl salicylate esterase n=1 Tax=Alloalcanivorax balearicus MACL04 TaxID=1177182 RepID=A0ABT2QW23_9GAMM|nr:alpha/beta fold hydrolase [Alloalcanivorax balearicus]MCU5781717.1 putative alkyl salicylate esterase [Alloalcanivorax balearicus MACL04]
MNDVILIHGAWAGAWVWDALAPLLRRQGFRPHALNLPGNGHGTGTAEQADFADCVACVETALDQLDGPTFLVAHSGGGVIATQAAENRPDRIAGVAYVAGMMLPTGTGFADLTRHLVQRNPAAAGIGPHLIWDEARRYSEVPPASARDIFFQDVDDAPAWAAARQLTPQPEGVRAGVAHWTAERFGTLPRLYVEALHDRSVILAAQRWMQQQVPGAEVATLDTGHAPQLASPAELGEILGSFFRRVSTHDKACPLHGPL